MSSYPLEKSYNDTRNPLKSDKDITLYQLWDEARKSGYVGNILNLETGERMTNLEILNLVSNTISNFLMHYNLPQNTTSLDTAGTARNFSRLV